MDRIDKALSKLTAREREKVGAILKQLNKTDITGLDIKKLKGREDIFRVRKGSLRIIYRVVATGDIVILEIARRSDTTYN